MMGINGRGSVYEVNHRLCLGQWLMRLTGWCAPVSRTGVAKWIHSGSEGNGLVS